MNTYQAIMAAADHIERNPDEFNVMSIETPSAPSCGTPGCALGWISFFCGVKPEGRGTGYYIHILGRLGIERDVTFYNRMDGITEDNPSVVCFGKWSRSGEACAAALRTYAEKYHGHEKFDPAYLKLRGDLNELQAGVMLEAM